MVHLRPSVEHGRSRLAIPRLPRESIYVRGATRGDVAVVAHLRGGSSRMAWCKTSGATGPVRVPATGENPVAEP